MLAIYPSYRTDDKMEKIDSASHTVDEATIDHGPNVDPSLIIDPIEERKFLRKVDVYLMTIFGALYLMCFLDRGNIGSVSLI